MRFISFIAHVLVFCFLTVLTQIGGVVYVLAFLVGLWLSKNRIFKYKLLTQLLVFLTLYTVTTIWLLPYTATYYGRVALPMNKSRLVGPLNLLTCMLNRHYVNKELSDVVHDVANELNTRFPGMKVNYLDANFPLLDKFPMLPHLSHNDGKKLDLAFQYIDVKSGRSTDKCPGFIGYGICEEAKADEVNMPTICEAKGYKQYNLLRKWLPQGQKVNFKVDEERTSTMLELLASKSIIGKIFVEPHLKTRWKLTNDKIRFHGCQAVRHDDHIHIQLIK